MTKYICWKIERRIACYKHNYPLSECRYKNVWEYICDLINNIIIGVYETN